MEVPQPARSRALARRDFLRRSAAAAVGVPSLAALLEACVRNPAARSVSGALTLATPEHPVSWPIAQDNQPIADDLEPERGALLRRHCEAKLAEADARVQAIVERADGTLGLKPVE